MYKRQVWLVADAAQGELRIMAYTGGVDPMDMGEDAFQWLVENTDGVFDEVAASTVIEFLKKPRDAAKQMVHACNYGEGMRLIENLGTASIKRERDAGVLHVFSDWVYENRYTIGFDAGPLARRFFGDTSWASRKKALAAQIKYMKAFPAIQRAQRSIMAEAERGYVITPSGHLLKLYGEAKDNIKKALAMNGQCSLSAYIQEALIAYNETQYPAIMYIHDELGFLVPEKWSADECVRFGSGMSHESKLLDGFRCPTSIAIGPTYFKPDLQELDN